MTDARIRVVVAEPGREPAARQIDATLAGLQACVGGTIELLWCGGNLGPFPGLVLYVHGEGRLLELPPMRWFGQWIFGPIVVTAEDTDGEMRSLTTWEAERVRGALLAASRV